ncbi:TetR/AcrR family transcriptional regulator [Hyphococcus lacteus]|uniref:TetR/AcrR family transcriptional regulator n=1 Tax=Hyphococcus lacteus TaxID=3143536 RepID=A0ABV3Z994_9PROT
MPEGKEKNADKRRKCVLLAAERSFVASGFHGARMAQIAKEAGMSPGHIYHYFESKGQIIEELIVTHFAEKMEMVEQFEQAGDKVVDHFIENLEKNLESSSDPFWSTLMLEIFSEATRNPEIAATLEKMDAEIKNRIIEAFRKNLDVEDLEARLEIFVAIIQGIGIRNIVAPDFDQRARIQKARDVAEFLFRQDENGMRAVEKAEA